MRADATTQDVGQAAQAAADAAVQAQAARAAGEQARLSGELARARAEVRAAEREARAQVDAGDGTRITTSPDGRTTTITEPGGKTTVISVDGDGRTTITQNGQTATLAPGPWSEPLQRLMERTQHSTEVPPAFPPQPREQIPDGVVPLIGIIFGMIAATIIGLPITRAFARRMDRKSAAVPAASPEVATRLDRIEQAVEAIAIEVERVSEGQRYSARLLTERLPESPARAVAAEHAR